MGNSMETGYGAPLGTIPLFIGNLTMKRNDVTHLQGACDEKRFVIVGTRGLSYSQEF